MLILKRVMIRARPLDINFGKGLVSYVRVANVIWNCVKVSDIEKAIEGLRT